MYRTGSSIICLLIVCVSFFGGMYISNVINEKAKEKEEMLQKQFEDYVKVEKVEYTYPQEADEKHQGISVSYTASVLKKKAYNEKLTQEENDLILDFSLQENGKGLAYTKYMEYGGDGMGKTTKRFWETSDNGETWNVLCEGQYSYGYCDITYIGDVFLESSFGTTAEKGYFNISKDGGHTFESIPCEEVFSIDDRVLYPEKTGENRHRKTVTYQWVDLYTREVVMKAEYDLEMNFISIVD